RLGVHQGHGGTQEIRHLLLLARLRLERNVQRKFGHRLLLATLLGNEDAFSPASQAELRLQSDFTGSHHRPASHLHDKDRFSGFAGSFGFPTERVPRLASTHRAAPARLAPRPPVGEDEAQQGEVQERHMTKIIYEIVEHDGGWAYRLDGVYSETFRSH